MYVSNCSLMNNTHNLSGRDTGCFAKRYKVDIMHNCGFSWPATNVTVRLSWSCFSFHRPDSLASSILAPSPSVEDGVLGVEWGLCF